MTQGTPPTPPTMTAIAVLLVVVLAIPYAVYRFTKWCCPLAGELVDRLLRLVGKLGRRVITGMTAVTWNRPVQRLGLGITVLCWMMALGAISTLVVLVSPNRASIWGLLEFWAVALVLWRLLQWWAERRYRTRRLPARRRP